MCEALKIHFPVQVEKKYLLNTETRYINKTIYGYNKVPSQRHSKSNRST